ILAARSRDNSRTPMQWSADANAGFTQGTPWLKPAANYTEINAVAAKADPDSVFWHYRDLIRLRKSHPIFTLGDYQELLPEHHQIWAYTRQWQGQTLLVVSNFYREPVDFVLPSHLDGQNAVPAQSKMQSIMPSHSQLLLSNYADTPTQPQSGQLLPYESAIWLIESV
ncbi:MAG: alpha-glucosidase C-terminal domain-containing protein, partial [Plesiomonas sp.]